MPSQHGRFPSLSHWGAFTAVVEDGRVIRCEPFPLDPHPSPMLDAIPAMVHSPLRIERPAVRAGWLKTRSGDGGRERRGEDGGARRGAEPFIEVSWDIALGLVAEELARVRARSGAEGIFGGSYGWSSAGRFHHARTLVRRFLFAGGGCVDQIGNYSWGCARFLLPHVVGTYAPVDGAVTHWPSIVRDTSLFVAFGGLAVKNGQVNSGGGGEHTMETWLRRARDAGCRFVVISPTRADCPEFLGATWIPIRPNTDTALMLALADVLIAERRCDETFLARYCHGFDRFSPYLTGERDGVRKTPEWASGITGVPAETIRALARDLAAHRTMLSAAWSLQRAHHGEQPYWMLITLAAMLGQIGLPGGGFGFGHGSINGIGNPRPDVPAPTLAHGNNPAGLAIPVARVADMLLHPGGEYEFNGRRERYPDIRLVYWAGGNPFHHHQDLNRLRTAWARPETVVVHDVWWTATARRADIVLPANTSLERNDVGGSSRDRFVFAMHQAIEPVRASRSDFDIFRDLAARGGFETAFTEGRDEAAWIRRIYSQARAANAAAGIELPDFEAFWDRGYAEQPVPDRDFVLFADFRRTPDAHPLRTPSGRIEIYSDVIEKFGYDDCPPHPAWLPPKEWLGAETARRFPLHLVTIQPPHRLHGQMDPGPVSAARKVAGREPVRMNPADASSRGLQAGDVVRVYNDRGACLAGVELDPGVAPAVVVMATGAWYDPVDENDRALDRHGNPNVLSFDEGTSRLAQGPSALSALVEVERYAGAPREIEVFCPPALAPAG
jgi:biotin/methionine sulfoxide reductase